MSNTKQITLSTLSIFCIIFGTLLLFTGLYWLSVALISTGSFCAFFLVKHVQSIESEDVIRNVSRETSVKNTQK